MKRILLPLLIILLLAGCKTMSTTKIPFVSDQDEASLAWRQDALMTSDSCDCFSSDQVQQFLNAYYLPNSEGVDIKVEEADIKESGRKAIKGYILASALINRSQICTAEALGLKETIETLKLEREILLSGTSLSKSEVEKHRDYSEEANAEINEKLKQENNLNSEQKKVMASSIALYLSGAYVTVQQKDPLMDYAKDIKQGVYDANHGGHIDPIKLLTKYADRNIPTLLALVCELPGHVEKTVKAGQSLLEFAKKNDIEVDSDATERLKQSADIWG